MGKHTSDFEKGMVYGMSICNKSQREIELETGIKKTTICRILQQIQTEKNYQRRIGSGMKKKITKKQSLVLCDIANENSRTNLREVREKFSIITGLSCCLNTIRSYL